MTNEAITITMDAKSGALSVPGWDLTPTAAVPLVRSAESFRNAFRFLHATTGYNAWWWGDVLVAYCEFEKKEGAAYAHYASEWEEIVGLSAGTLQSYCAVARAFKPTSRLGTLSWSHHDEIVHAGITDPHEMQDWLTQAEANKWSKTTLRAQLRAHKRAQDDKGDDSQPVVIEQGWLFAAKTGARTWLPRVQTMSTDELDRLLADLQPMIALAKAAAERRQLLAGAAKESLSPAA